MRGRVALVTGASRGVGRGIALGLGEAGCTVYVTGRTVKAGEGPLPGTIHETAEELTRLGGEGIAVQCDHRDDAQVREVFARIEADHGRHDVLVNNACHVEVDTAERVSWEMGPEAWDQMHSVGLRNHFVASCLAIPLMARRGGGLIANVSSTGASRFLFNAIYGSVKCALDRLTGDMAEEFKKRKLPITVVSLWPGMVKTERMIAAKEYFRRRHFADVENAGETGQYTGRAVVALATDPKVHRKSGRALQVADLARAYGFTDVDGRQPGALLSPRAVVENLVWLARGALTRSDRA